MLTLRVKNLKTQIFYNATHELVINFTLLYWTPGRSCTVWRCSMKAVRGFPRWVPFQIYTLFDLIWKQRHARKLRKFVQTGENDFYLFFYRIQRLIVYGTLKIRVTWVDLKNCFNSKKKQSLNIYKFMFLSWVVFPHPVSPVITVTWCFLTKSRRKKTLEKICIEEN